MPGARGEFIVLHLNALNAGPERENPIFRIAELHQVADIEMGLQPGLWNWSTKARNRVADVRGAVGRVLARGRPPAGLQQADGASAAVQGDRPTKP